MLYSKYSCGKIRCCSSRISLLHSSGRSQNIDKSDPKKWLSRISSSLHSKGEVLLQKSYERTKGLFSAFDEVLGITEVKEAQFSVRLAEEKFLNTRRQVQEIQNELNLIQERLSDVRRRLDRTPRDEESYLNLATEEHKILVEVKKLKNEFECLEVLERDQFTFLSAVVRDSHEKERSRAERTKHWSVIGSIGGAALGILGSSVMNYLRLKEIKNSVKGTGATLMERTEDLHKLMEEQDSQLKSQKVDFQESISVLAQQIEQRLLELSSVLELYTLNQSGDSLFKGLFLGNSRSHTKSTEKQESSMSGEKGHQQQFEESLKDLNVRVESVLSLVKDKCAEIQEGVSEVQTGIKKVENSLLIQQKKSDDQTKVNDVPSTTGGLTVSHSSSELYSPVETLHDREWWTKVSTISSVICTFVSVGVIVYELCK